MTLPTLDHIWPPIQSPRAKPWRSRTRDRLAILVFAIVLAALLFAWTLILRTAPLGWW